MASGSKNLKISTNTCFAVSFQKNVFSSFLLFWSVCYQDDLCNSERNEIASSAARNFNNSWLLYVKFSETIKLCQNIWLIKNWKCQLFVFWNKRRQKGWYFQFFKGKFLLNAWPYGYDFGVFLETYVRLLTSITSQLFSRYSKSYNNLNVKKCLKLNGP